MSKVNKKGANKKLHSKLLKRKKDKKQEAKDERKARLRELNKLAGEQKANDSEEEG